MTIIFIVKNYVLCYENSDTFISYIFQDRDEQKRLEMKHRKEEDDLYRKFARQRQEEEQRIRDEIRVSHQSI